jgi:hypothetical protein
MKKDKPMTVGDVRKKLEGFPDNMPIMTFKDIDWNQYKAKPILSIDEIDISEDGNNFMCEKIGVDHRQLYYQSFGDDRPKGKAVIIWQ